MRQKVGLTSNFFHLAKLGKSFSYSMRCILHKADEPHRETVAPQ